MLRRPTVPLAFLFAVLSLVNTAHAAPVTINVTIKSFDAAARTITVMHGDKERTFDLSRRTKIVVADMEASPSGLIGGDTAKLTYDDTLDVVLTIEAAGLGADQWQFYDVMKKGVKLNQCVAVTSDGTLVCLRGKPFFCLATPRQYSEMTLTMEYQIPPQQRGGADIYVASTLPRPEQEDWTRQIPQGLEFKLGPGEPSLLIVPNEAFEVELPLGQLRDGRKIVPLRKPVLKPAEWNTLEVTVDKHRNVTFKVNDQTINAIAKAQNTTGHILIGSKGGFRVRNAVVMHDGQETPRPFTAIHPN